MRSRTQNRLIVLAPANVPAPGIFRNIETDSHRHGSLLAEMQRFRGAAYVSDGAVSAADLTADGRHKLAVDEKSWHVLSLDSDNRICACLRYLDETRAGKFEDLWIRHSALSHVPTLGKRFRRAVEGGMKQARRMGLRFGEVGGWAVDEAHRCTFEAVRIILATYGLLRLLGGALGVATATVRHKSAPILRRIGLTSLVEGGEEVAPYFDPQYGCQMEVLQFDSQCPAPKYEGWVSELAEALRTAPVICREPRQTLVQGMLAGFQLQPQLREAVSW